MKKLCVYTCITGSYDNIHEIENKESGVDYYLFTNNKDLKSNTWNVIYIEDNTLDNQRLSRKIKMLGHPLINENYEMSVWQDASVIWKKSIKEFVNTYLKENSFASFKHYLRNCIYDEANECIRTRKDKKDIILKHVEFLKKENYPKQNGLCEMTVFIKKHNDRIVRKTMQDWFEMVCNYSKRDQLSFMYCVWKNDLKIDFINLSVWDNQWFTNKKHNSKQNITHARIYYGNDLEFNPLFDDQPEYRIKSNKYSITSKVLTDTNVIEIEITDVPVVEYKNLKIEGLEIENITYFNSIDYKERKIFYSNSGIIKLDGKFKNNQKFKLEVELFPLDNVEKNDLIEYLSIEKITLTNEKNNLNQELEKILNSKSWKITKPLRKFK